MDTQAFAQRYDFPLDGFQEDAIEHLARGHSVLVAAPTGSGKTVIAEYALERARETGAKFFYTTPLKALSNQKFRDLVAAYSLADVGLLTGDNSINSDAPIVVMTTEVLRNMIYEKSTLLSDLGYVVLDEVHYMQDPFRGAVWEEIVIMLPAPVRLVGLSATVSNAVDLAGWMDSLRGDVKVVVSSERPVKLKNHYFVGSALVPLFSKNLFRVINEQMDRIKKAPAPQHGGRRRGRSPDLRPRRVAVIKELDKREMLPAIYFLFSRAACQDSVSEWVAKGQSLTSSTERDEISKYLEEKVSSLERADLDCLNFHEVKAGLISGVAAHHAGALPLFKEAVEELFTRGLVKVVFATETLSLGINMPARSVIIESVVKWSGEEHRPLTPGEYKQLTGRAGRRGIDEVGYSIVLYQRFFSPEQLRNLVTKEPHPVVSSFEVTYNMAVNLLTERSIEEAQKLINLSFAQYEADRRVVTLEARLETLEEELERDLEASRCAEGGNASSFRDLEARQARLSRKLASLSRERRQREVRDALIDLKPGDVFVAGREDKKRALAVVKKSQGKGGETELMVVDPAGRYQKMTKRAFKVAPSKVGSVDVNKVTSPTKKVRRSVGSKLEELALSAPDAEERRVPDEEREIADGIAGLTDELERNPCHACSHKPRCLEAARKAERADRKIAQARKERDRGYDVVSRRLVDVVGLLNDFGFMDENSVTRKGSMLRQIYNECDLIMVDAIEEGLASRLEPAELAAFASWFIYESRESESPAEARTRREHEHLEGVLGDVLDRLEEMEAHVKSSEAKRRLDLLGSLDTGFSEAAHMWASGADLDEMLARFPGRSVGDMVRTMKQIIDLMRQAAEVSPDPVLTRNLRRAMDAVDRGIVGYSSLESIIEHEARERD